MMNQTRPYMCIKKQTSIGNIAVSICYRPPDQEEMDEAFYKQLKVASHSQDLFLMGNFNLFDICSKNNTAV